MVELINSGSFRPTTRSRIYSYTGLVYTEGRQQPWAVWVKGILWSYHTDLDEAKRALARAKRWS